MISEKDFPVSIMESLQKEKQIMVDSLSSLQLSKPKFMSLSLPNSANSSPLLTSKRKPKGEIIESRRQDSNLTLKQQCMLQEFILRKSKSCGERRASLSPFDEFDHWLIKPKAAKHDNNNHESFFKSEAIKESYASDNELETIADKGFKCSALCMYLPGFGKGKSGKPKKEGLEMEGTISRTVSLEKFECGSWSSSKLFNDIETDHTSSYFDLPLELINGNNTNDVHLPITSTFVFEKNLKGVLKNGSSKPNGRKSDTSPHQVRFSMSSSTSRYPPPSPPISCNTPSLINAKDDFNAFLEANTT